MCSVFFFKQKTAYEMRISDWSSDVCSSDLGEQQRGQDQTRSTHDKPPARLPVAQGVSYLQYGSTTFVVDSTQRRRPAQISSAPTTARIAPLRVHTRSPSMKLLAGQRTPSSPCNIHSSPISTAAMPTIVRSEAHTSELQSLMRISYAVFCLKQKQQKHT